MKYPVVLIHGLYGYGEQDEAKRGELLPYWGYKGNDLAHTSRTRDMKFTLRHLGRTTPHGTEPASCGHICSVAR